jgi:asparagine synthase (glutamine-hydrolysing)
MCGIAGWYRREGRPVARQAVACMCDRLIHRGPDDSGILLDGDFGLGMRRLSIIDIAGGHQPIESPDGRFAIVCNGEIVNHPDLRRELERGYQFRTHSDVETLLAAWLRWGDEAWLKVEGMFAAAIWDRETKVLTLARDALGIKPLYFTEQKGGIAFASEITALRELPGLEFDIGERGLHDFFRFGHVLAPRSIFRQVQVLEPGHLLRIGPVGRPAIRRYWTPRIAVDHGLTEADWVEETRRRLLQTVEQHLLADVPVGAFLSGGVDSSAVAAAMARTGGTGFKAFTAGFPGSRRDETEAAARVAAHLGVEHVVLPIQPQTAADVLPAVQRSFDEPTAANSAVPLWYLSRAAAPHVRVVLCGEGGDELFLGYNRLRWARRMERAAPVVRALGGLGFLDRIGHSRHRRINYARDHAFRFREGALRHDGFERFFSAVTITSPAVRAQIYDPAFRERQEQADGLEALASEYFPGREPQLSGTEQFQLGDLAVHMPASLLQRLDRASMAHSLEARVPFLTRGFVDWALTIPADLKLRGNVGKYVLRRAVEPWLPPLGKAKLGFQMPLADWFTGGFNDFARDAWRSSGAADAGFLDPKGVEALFDDHRLGKSNHGRILYALAMFSCWWKEQRFVPQPSTERARVGGAV